MLQEHSPHPVALDAFNQVNHTIKHELIKLRHHWNKHEPRMFDRVKHLSDDVLTGWDLERDLVTVRSGPIAYGVILLGKASDTCLFSCPAIRIPGVQDARGEGFVHVRLHDPPTGNGKRDIELHSIFTNEVRENDKVVEWEAIQTNDVPLVFFSE